MSVTWDEPTVRFLFLFFQTGQLLLDLIQGLAEGFRIAFIGGGFNPVHHVGPGEQEALAFVGNGLFGCRIAIAGGGARTMPIVFPLGGFSVLGGFNL